MIKIGRWYRTAALATLTAIAVAGCGGGTNATFQKVYVMGDSLADVGTFGYKFTVQDSTNPKGFPIWSQILADTFGLPGSAQCNFFTFGSGTFSPNPTAGCTNYAIGGGAIVIGAAAGGSANPLTIGTQMAARAASGNYTGTDLVLIDGGGNDAANLVGSYLGAATPSGQAAYQTFLLQQLDATTVGALLPQANGPALAAGAYMQKLADTFYGQIRSQVLDKGARYVAVLNMPDVTLTPRFQAVLAGVAAQSNAATATALQSAIR